MFCQYYHSPVGTLLLQCSEQALQQVTIGEPVPADAAIQDHWILQQTTEYLQSYFAGKKVSPDSLPLELHGTDFQKLIWNLLRQIPYGSAVTYGQLSGQAAEKMQAKAMSAQAVGQALSANKLLIIVPCHRVLAAGSRLGGFSCGVEIKQKLLKIENIKYRV